MSPERIKTFLTEKPFKPFTVHTGDGKEVDVLSPEFAYLHPGGRTLWISVPKKPGAKQEEDFDEHHVDVFLVTKVTTPIKRPGGSRRRNGHR
jgi:hypothetical protein